MKNLENELAVNFPVLYLYKPIQAVYAAIFAFGISFIVLYAQESFEYAATSSVSLITLLIICGVAGFAWVMSLADVDKPTHLIIYRRHHYRFIVLATLVFIVLGPYAILPFNFGKFDKVFPSVAITPILMPAVIVIISALPDDGNMMSGRLVAFIGFIVVALFRWFGVPWLFVGFMLIGALLYVIFSFYTGFVISRSRGSVQAIFTSAALSMITFAFISLILCLIVLTAQRFGMKFDRQLNLSMLGSSEITDILIQFDLYFIILCLLVAAAVFDIERLVISCFAELPRE